MPPPSSPETSVKQRDLDLVARFGGWLFQNRTSIPVPIVLALLLIPPPASSASVGWLPWGGGALIALGELIRLWGVHHIGAISRTRSDRLGPLVASGPFAHVRNPLYVGNILLWLGFSMAARLLWLAPIVFSLLAIEYHAIVRWEEQLLATRMGEPYRAYLQRVPRWIPTFSPVPGDTSDARFSWRETVYSERGTLIAIVAGYLLLALKARVF